MVARTRVCGVHACVCMRESVRAFVCVCVCVCVSYCQDAVTKIHKPIL